MYRQSSRSRGQRSTKGFKVRRGLQLILMLGVGVWLFYQTQRSYNHKDKSWGEDVNISERLRLGRKDMPHFGDAVTPTRDNGDVKFGGSEKIDEVGSKRKGNGGGYGIKNKMDDKKEAKKVRNGGMKKENEKARGGEMKGDVKDGKIKNLMSSNDQVQDGSDKDEKVMAEKQNRDIENGFAQDASVKSSNKERKIVSDSDKTESSDSIDSGEDKLANTTAFSDETFASHSQNETADDLGAKTRKGETVVDSYQSDSNADPTLKTGDSTTFSDTNGNEEANGVENPRSFSSGTYENIRLDKPDTSHNSASQEQKTKNKKEPSENNSQVKKDESLSTNDNVKQHEQVKSSNRVSERQKEDANGEHHEVNSSVSEEVQDRTDLDTLPNTDNQTHSKDAVAL